MRSSSLYASVSLLIGSKNKSAGCSVTFCYIFVVVCERWKSFDNRFSTILLWYLRQAEWFLIKHISLNNKLFYSYFEGVSKKKKSSSETDCCSEFSDVCSVFVMFSSLWCLQQLGWLDSYVGPARSSNFYVFSYLAYSDKWNGYELTDKCACCSVAFHIFLLLFAKGGIISITVFLLFYCDVCDKRNDFWLNLFLWIICFCVPNFKEWAKNRMAHQKLIAVQSVWMFAQF